MQMKSAHAQGGLLNLLPPSSFSMADDVLDVTSYEPTGARKPHSASEGRDKGAPRVAGTTSRMWFSRAGGFVTGNSSTSSAMESIVAGTSAARNF